MVLAKWLSVHLRTKWLWVRVQLQSPWQKRLQRTTSWWITKRKVVKCDRFGLLSVTEWVTKCDKMIYKVRQGLQSARGLLKGNGTKPAIYIHCLNVQSIIIQHLKYCMKKVFLMIGTILSEYTIADIIRDIFTYTFFINVLLNVFQCHNNENSSFMNS